MKSQDRYYWEQIRWAGFIYPSIDISVRTSPSGGINRALYFETLVEKEGRLIPVSNSYELPIGTFNGFVAKLGEAYRHFDRFVEPIKEKFIVTDENSIEKL